MHESGVDMRSRKSRNGRLGMFVYCCVQDCTCEAWTSMCILWRPIPFTDPSLTDQDWAMREVPRAPKLASSAAVQLLCFTGIESRRFCSCWIALILLVFSRYSVGKVPLLRFDVSHLLQYKHNHGSLSRIGTSKSNQLTYS